MSTTTTTLLTYLGQKGSSSPTQLEPAQKPAKASMRALPSLWYTSPKFYDLERRAIFSKKWLFLTLRSRFKEAGDSLRYEIAGFDFIVALDRSGQINSFHNICRHRAYPVVEDVSSSRAKIFACRYHGWSYGLNGKLAKAPNYQELDSGSFDKSKSGLFPIHTHIVVNGFIWINFDASPSPEPWETDFRNVDTQAQFAKFNFDNYELDHTYTLEDAHDVETKGGHMQHNHSPTEEQRSKGFDVNSTYYFPNARMSVSPHFLMIQRFHPHSPSHSTMSYEMYRNTTSRRADFELISGNHARVMAEDKVLCEGQQRNLERGVFVNGLLHPCWEVWPARQQDLQGRDAEMCEGMGCGEERKELEW